MQEKTQSTYSSEPVKEFNIETLKKLAYTMKVGRPEVPTKKKGWFERVMNRYGWYRQSEWYILDSKKFGVDLAMGSSFTGQIKTKL